MKLDLQGSAFCPERERTACRGDGLPASGATETHLRLGLSHGRSPRYRCPSLAPSRKSGNPLPMSAIGGRPETFARSELLLVLTRSGLREHSLDLPTGLSHRPRDGSVVSSLHCMNDPQPEGHMASYIGRRKFLAALGGAASAWPLVARAQQSRRVGVLMGSPATDSVGQAYLAAFVQALRQLGWMEGQNLRIDVRWNSGGSALAQTYAAQLIGLQPDVIFAASTLNLEAIRQATTTVPVVFVQVSDPVAQGFVASLTKPGGNLTGFSAYEFSTGGKWLDLLKEIAPGLAHAGVMFNPDRSPQSKFFMKAVEAAASSHG